MTVDEVIKHAQKSGVEVFCVASYSNDDAICVKVVKTDFIYTLRKMSDPDVEADMCSITGSGDILYG